MRLVFLVEFSITCYYIKHMLSKAKIHQKRLQKNLPSQFSKTYLSIKLLFNCLHLQYNYDIC